MLNQAFPKQRSQVGAIKSSSHSLLLSPDKGTFDGSDKFIIYNACQQLLFLKCLISMTTKMKGTNKKSD